MKRKILSFVVAGFYASKSLAAVMSISGAIGGAIVGTDFSEDTEGTENGGNNWPGY